MGCKDIPLERRAKIAATVDMIVSTINLVVQSVSLNKTNEIINDENTTETEKDEAKLTRYFTIILLCIATIKLVMGAVLWIGATRRNSTYVRAWLIVAVILWIIQLSDYIANLAKGSFQWLPTITTGLTLIIRCLVFIGVTLFIRELESENTNGHFGEDGMAMRNNDK